ncbi:MAG: SIMPL domain-containing protein [Hydrogenibacillus sp.]|nr:SIMPL domain-containing protein [Hydrogenibacillus sp.]
MKSFFRNMLETREPWRATAVLILALSLILVGGVLWSSRLPHTDAAGDPAVVNAGQDAKPSIQVEGHGRISGTPDVAWVTLGVETEAETAEKALSDNARVMDDIRKTIKTLGIDDRDVKTAVFNTQAVYDYNERRRVLRGYQTIHLLQVTVRRVDRLGELLDRTGAVGANRIDGVQFGVEEAAALQKAALERAVSDARAKAEVLAEKSGLKIVGVRTVVELPSNPSPMPRMMYDIKREAAYSGASPATEVLPGELVWEAAVQMVFDVR